MTLELEIEYLWIPHDLGGHRSDPYLGMRPTVRWQRYQRESLDHARDGECTSVAFDQVTKRGFATLRLVSDEPVPMEWRGEGSLIELLDGYRVIAVGRICRFSQSPS
jgi:hypothetical protein